MTKKYKCRFFFDYSSGGCLWLDNIQDHDKFSNPIDARIYDLKGNLLYNPEDLLPLSKETFLLIEELDRLYLESFDRDYSQKHYHWKQSQYDDFNYKVDVLFNKIKNELEKDFEIINEQEKIMLN
jgi:hypothetical protein